MFQMSRLILTVCLISFSLDLLGKSRRNPGISKKAKGILMKSGFECEAHHRVFLYRGYYMVDVFPMANVWEEVKESEDIQDK